ncbi:MAG: Mrp/NBP35 family ATP-binding protein [Clostridiaceae bacterium]|nr:Mrp/NBP35 family ATP-binding protein [Clostridiaceae bacterium]
MSSCETCPSHAQCSSADQEKCPSRNGAEKGQEQTDKPSFLEPHTLASVRSIIGVCSGKGGVGKSLVTSLLAVGLARQGLTVGILDADITGPSIPKAFGLRGQLSGSEDGIFPAQTHSGIQVVSVNLMLENPEAPVIWRGPVISGVVRQFWTDVIWDGLDVLLIDMPPGTGDVPLTVFQSIPLDGIFMVSTPQDLVSLIVRKARNMALMMQVRVLGFVENMSSVLCPDCGRQIELFGPGHTGEAAAEMNVPLLDRVPIDPALAALCDEGKIEQYERDLLPGTIAAIQKLLAGKPV